MRFLPTPAVLGLAIVLLTACSSDPTDPGDDRSGPAVDPATHIDSGHIGLVIDTRAIFHRGYEPAEARISFAGHGDRDAVLAVDALTSVAILSVPNDDLDAAEQAAFAAGVPTTIVVTAADGAELGRLEHGALVLGDTNQPLAIGTDLPAILPELHLREDLPYLIQREGWSGFMAPGDDWGEWTYTFDNTLAIQHHFTEVGGAGSGVYTIRLDDQAYPDMNHWYVTDEVEPSLLYRGAAAGGGDEFSFEPDLEGWVRIRHVASGLYVTFEDLTFVGLGPAGDRFRFISDTITWSVEDRGTHFNQPIMPPARLDFAYAGRLSNCSSAGLEETVGTTEARTTTTTIGTSESLALFAGYTTAYELTYSAEVSAGLGFEAGPVGGSADVAFGVDETWSQEFTTEQTRAYDNTWSREVTQTTEVSRERTVTVNPYSVIDVQDAIKTMRNVRVPFTQVLRIRGVDRRDGSTPLSGVQLATQILFNQATCLIRDVSVDYVDVTVRGEAHVDQMLNATTLVREVENGCD